MARLIATRPAWRRDATRSRGIRREDIGMQAVVRIVCDLDRMIFIAIREHRKHRPEDFLARDRQRRCGSSSVSEAC
jgi:hypothetical protein